MNPKKLQAAKYVIKLTLQQNGFVPDELKRLFFDDDSDEISIVDLARKFEKINITGAKANLLARYIVEPKFGDQQIVYDEHLTCEVSKATDLLLDFVGPYQVFADNVPFGKDEDDYCSETEVRLQCIETFLKYLPALKDALSAEDYENSGLCDHIQIREAIQSVHEDVDNQLLDWMVFYVFNQSESVEKMKYRVLTQLLEEELDKKPSRVASAKPRRPESSNPAKIAKHNPTPKPVEEKRDEYSDSDNDGFGDINDLKQHHQQQSNNYDESPRMRQMDALRDINELEEDDDYNQPNRGSQDQQADEDQMIDTAEKIFVRIADEIMKQQVTIRDVW